MPINFQKAPTVEIGDKVTSTHLALLAKAFNDRLRSGLADPTYRIFYILYGLFRQIRNPDESGFLFPSEAEFFEYYALLDKTIDWPETGPGDPEGVNVVSMMPGFVYGVDVIDIEDEKDRINDVGPGASGSDIEGGWEDAKSQRGGANITSGTIHTSAPAWKAASEHYKLELRRGNYSKHGTSYGGFMPLSLGGLLGCTLHKMKDVLDRVLNFYIKDYNDFDFEKFFGWQYALTPNNGTLIDTGDTDPFTGEEIYDVATIYPLFKFLGSTSLTFTGGSFAVNTADSSDHHTYNSNFILGSFIARGRKIAAPFTLNVMNGSTLIQAITYTPDGTGKVAQVTLFQNPVSPNLKYQLATTLTFTDSSGYLELESTEQIPGKPQIPDGYLVLRAGGGVNGVGGAAISDAYFATGSIQGSGVVDDDSLGINRNEVFDAAKRMSQSVRVIRHQLLRGYEVTSDGKSVLYFKRFETIETEHVDVFKGIAPSKDPISSGNIQANRVYLVKGTTGHITYNGSNYGIGSQFTGARVGFPDLATHTTVTTYTSTGDAEVREYDGIIHTAPPEGYTNEWLTGVQLKIYNPNEGAILDIDSYTDFFALSNRCHFGNARITPLDPDTVDISLQFSFGVELNLAPDAPSGYNYIRHTNDVPGTDFVGMDRFYRSCRIYEPDPEIESVTELRVGSEDQIKITYKTRFHHCDEAPAVIPNDPSFNLTDLHNEPYRTMENAIREYLAITQGVNCSIKIGDTASLIFSDLLSGCHGACYPHFFFTKLIPSPYEDNNDNQDCDDTLVSSGVMTQMELYLRAMSEGYIAGRHEFVEEVDGILICAGGSYDYTFNLLCLKAFGGSWGLSMLPGYGPVGVADPGLRNVPLRPEKPKGNGVLPNTFMYAEVFNQYAKCLNLLVDVRLELPMLFEHKTTWYRDFYPAPAEACVFPDPLCVPVCCDEFGNPIECTPDPCPCGPQDCVEVPNDTPPPACYNPKLLYEIEAPDNREIKFLARHCEGLAGTIPGGLDATTDISNTSWEYWMPDPDHPGEYIPNPDSSFQWQPTFSIDPRTSIQAQFALVGPGHAVAFDNLEGGCTPLLQVFKEVVQVRASTNHPASAALPPLIAANLDSVGVTGKLRYERSWERYAPSDEVPYTIDCTSDDCGSSGVLTTAVCEHSGPCAGISGENCWDTNHGCQPCFGELLDNGDISEKCGFINGETTLVPKPIHESSNYWYPVPGFDIPKFGGSGSVVSFLPESCTTGFHVTATLVGIPDAPNVTLTPLDTTTTTTPM